MHTFEYKKIKRQYPGSWNELDLNQLLLISKLLLQHVPVDTMSVLLLQNFLKMNDKEFYSLNPTIITELIAHISFVHKPSRLTQQLLPYLKTSEVILKGPESALQDCTFEQFFWHSEVYYNNLHKSGKESLLNELAASLYIDRTFNSDNISYFARLIAPHPREIKYAIYLFYTGCRGFLATKFPKVFSGVATGPADEFSPVRMLTALNSNDMTKNPGIKQTNIYEALVQIEENITQNEKLKRK
jgi:hypothetical protein